MELANEVVKPGLFHFALMLLITQFLLSKYSRPNFSALIAVFILQIVQIAKKLIFFLFDK